MIEGIGGLGLFLLGMAFLTDGLKQVAGPSLGDMLHRFTRGRPTAILTGAAVTAVVQSSSATTLAAIGFVNAGLLNLGQAVGVIYGANLGTTLTGWIVGLVGVKVNASLFGLPFVGLGSLLKLFARGRLSSFGVALAGFGLIFHGIDLMQAGMAGGVGLFTPGGLSSESLLGRVGLVAVGAVMTVVMQSSSAALAVTLAAVSTGTLALPDAAALAIGQNIGTTATAVLGSLKATATARRAAAAHVLFNLVTGVVAILLFSPLLGAVSFAAHYLLGDVDEPAVIAAFHTCFNLLGVALMTPLIPRQVAYLERIIVDDVRFGQPRYLDKNVLLVPATALAAAERELDHLRELTLGCVVVALELPEAQEIRTAPRESLVPRALRSLLAAVGIDLDGDARTTPSADELLAASNELAASIASVIERIERSPGLAGRMFAVLQSITHLRSAAEQGVRAARHLKRARRPSTSVPAVMELERLVAEAITLWRADTPPVSAKADLLSGIFERAEELRAAARRSVFESVAQGTLPSTPAIELADYAAHLERIVYDLARAAFYESGAYAALTAEPIAPPETLAPPATTASP